ncbi:MAG: CHAT domain-containing protein [Gemmatimonadaceae bacterium]
MNALLIRIGEKGPNGYALSLYSGQEADVLMRANDDSAKPDVSSVIPLDFASSLSIKDMACASVQDTRLMLVKAGASNTILRDLGIRLFELLNRDDVGKRWAAERDAANALNVPVGTVKLRTYLDVRDEELARIPWELLFDKSEGVALSRSDAGMPIVRYSKSVLSKIATTDSGIADSELRVLLIVGCRPEANAVRWLDELRSFLELVCPQRNIIDFEIFEAQAQTERGKLKAVLRSAIEDFQPHILHFIGHGRIENGEGALELFDASVNNEIAWTAEEFKSFLTQSPPRLVLLNACRTSTAAADGDAPIRVLASMSASALSAKVASVISMQHDITSDAAVTFSKTFYTQLVAQQPLDVAVTKGRIAISDLPEPPGMNWPLPVCNVCMAPEAVLPRPNLFRGQRQQAIKLHRDFSQLSAYVDRRKERRALLQAQGATGRNVQFVLSNTLMGKSSLAKLICEWRLLNGEQIIYVDFGKAQGTPLDTIDILRHVRGAQNGPKDLMRPNVYANFVRFNDTLNAVLTAQLVEAVPSTGIDNGARFDRTLFSAQNGWSLIFEAFLKDLATVAKDGPVTIVLDHLCKGGTWNVVLDDFKQHIVEFLLTPIRDADAGNLSVIVVVTRSEVETIGVKEWAEPGVSVELNDFACQNLDVIAREFAVRTKLDSRLFEATLEIYKNILGSKTSFKPKSFTTMRNMYDDSLTGSE